MRQKDGNNSWIWLWPIWGRCSSWPARRNPLIMCVRMTGYLPRNERVPPRCKPGASPQTVRSLASRCSFLNNVMMLHQLCMKVDFMKARGQIPQAQDGLCNPCGSWLTVRSPRMALLSGCPHLLGLYMTMFNGRVVINSELEWVWSKSCMGCFKILLWNICLEQVLKRLEDFSLDNWSWKTKFKPGVLLNVRKEC
jgi:hypothetical protein